VSGWLFILIGTVLGFIFFMFAADFFQISEGIRGTIGGNFKERLGYRLVHPRLFNFLAGISMIGGAWVGAAVHQMIGGAIKQSSNQTSPHTSEQRDTRQNHTEHSDAGHPNDSKIIVCGNCGQKLRVPIRSSRLLVKCKKCKHEFYH
jgi:hypothetical protein